MKKVICISIVLISLTAIYLSARWYQKEMIAQNEIDARRQYVLCERLEKNMNKDEVLGVLSEYGNFKYGESSSGGRSSEIFGNYDDASVIGESTVHLVFLDEKYDNAYIKTFDQGKSVCASQ